MWYVTLKVFSSFIPKNFVYTRVEIIVGEEVLGTSLAFALVIGNLSVDFLLKENAEIKLLRTGNPLSCRMVRSFQMLVRHLVSQYELCDS